MKIMDRNERINRFSLADFSILVDSGGIIDYDGFGLWATFDHVSEDVVDLENLTPPDPKCKFIVWYNR